MPETRPSLITRAPEELEALRPATEARIALGRSGTGLPTAAVQAFLLDHARAREAVWRPLDVEAVERELISFGVTVVHVASWAKDRAEYLRRPDLGRRLSPDHSLALGEREKEVDVALIVADGLSATAVERNAAPLVAALLPLLQGQGLTMGPIVLATQARVALGDDVGVALKARVTVMLIGERPGLSAVDSLGAYLTHAPQTNLPDSRRNCISNIRDGGLPIAEAASRIAMLISAMLKQATSGVTLIESETPTGFLSG
ncbi:ethanolamine ammonia-lyase light chain [Brucella endophytica]|uniref:Ethanolamine ammonia-lyase small subunit n=1 Tax=Brucella endophytica TaxID=1963359 RepID=A0A916SHG9_9HYPH|nr:ethanolamine ammonia-lyase subunit EutC [Brucella endophytica]GGA99574.1 ethanolamine ammonia-lyase light chain [Brucella endophytica]